MTTRNYLVCYGWLEQERAEFDDWAEALAEYRKRDAEGSSRRWESARIFGANYDGERDGLTESERLEAYGI